MLVVIVDVVVRGDDKRRGSGTTATPSCHQQRACDPRARARRGRLRQCDSRTCCSRHNRVRPRPGVVVCRADGGRGCGRLSPLSDDRQHALPPDRETPAQPDKESPWNVPHRLVGVQDVALREGAIGRVAPSIGPGAVDIQEGISKHCHRRQWGDELDDRCERH